jgi:hypothetical protein
VADEGKDVSATIQVECDCIALDGLRCAGPLARAFRPYRKQPPTKAQCVYLVRSQEAVALAVLLTLLADTVALARHPSLWARAVSGRELIVLLGGVAVIALGVQSVVRNSQRQMADTRSTPWGRAIFTLLLATFVLAVCPNN